MKRNVTLLLAVSLLSFFILPHVVKAAQIEGTVQGLTCVTQGKLCPAGQKDPVVAAEDNFVLLTREGDYYFIPNLSREIMARHIRETVRVTGEMSEKYKAINASSLKVKQDGEWKTTWSKEMEQKWRDQMYLEH